MSEQPNFYRGQRVAVSCQMVHTVYGGLTNTVHTHTGTVASMSIYGNVYVHLDDSAGQPRKCRPETLTRLVTS